VLTIFIVTKIHAWRVVGRCDDPAARGDVSTPYTALPCGGTSAFLEAIDDTLEPIHHLVVCPDNQAFTAAS
jgi:hypothetical protein